jgi:Rrf2 family protein
MRISARSDYAVRAAIVIARAWPGVRVTGEEISAATSLPHSFLESILGDLRRAGIIHGRRGYRGGYVLTRPPERIKVADLLLAVDCPLLTGPGGWDASPIAPLWAKVETSTRELLAGYSLADLASDALVPITRPAARSRRAQTGQESRSSGSGRRRRAR